MLLPCNLDAFENKNKTSRTRFLYTKFVNSYATKIVIIFWGISKYYNEMREYKLV